MSISNLFTSKKKEAASELPNTLQCRLTVTLKNGTYFALNRAYESERTLEEPWEEFITWFRADVGAKSFTLEWSNNKLNFGQRTVVKTEIQMIIISVQDEPV